MENENEVKINYENGLKCFLISVIYKDFTSGYFYKHGKKQLTDFIKWLCDDAQNDTIYDFRVFERVEIDL